MELDEWLGVIAKENGEWKDKESLSYSYVLTSETESTKAVDICMFRRLSDAIQLVFEARDSLER